MLIPDPILAKSGINLTSESVIQHFGSADPDPKEILTDPQHRLRIPFISVQVRPSAPLSNIIDIDPSIELGSVIKTSSKSA